MQPQLKRHPETGVYYMENEEGNVCNDNGDEVKSAPVDQPAKPKGRPPAKK